MKYLHFLFLSLITEKYKKIIIYERLFPKDEDCNLSSKEKGRLSLKPFISFFVL